MYYRGFCGDCGSNLFGHTEVSILYFLFELHIYCQFFIKYRPILHKQKIKIVHNYYLLILCILIIIQSGMWTVRTGSLGKMAPEPAREVFVSHTAQWVPRIKIDGVHYQGDAP